MIHDAARLRLPARLRCELCVVGSGPGGATAAMVAAEAGLDVVLLEAGPLVTPGEMTQREEEMFPRLYWHAGARTTVDRAVHVHQGRGVGGSSLHNLNLCKRIPAPLLARWGLEHLPPATWAALYDEVEALLGVSPIAAMNRHNDLLRRGCEALGWAGGPLAHNRTGCIGSGFCEVGCAYDAKNNALKVMVPRFVKAGGRVLTHCQAVRVIHARGRIRGVEVAVIAEETRDVVGALTIEADRVCLAASATGTPGVLLRSDVPDPSGRTGRTLRLHPGLAAAGDFPEEVRAWQGIPQSWECTEWLGFGEGDPRAWITTAFAHPMGLATLLPGHGAAHRDFMNRYAHLGVFSAMLHDETAGVVEPAGDLDVAIDYRPTDADRHALRVGLGACVRLLFAAGAMRALVPGHGVLRPGEPLPDALTLGDLTAVHPMASVAMGDDPRSAAVDSRGRHHHVQGLFIADGSLFPTSIGVPPQLSIYALGLHVGRAIAHS